MIEDLIRTRRLEHRDRMLEKWDKSVPERYRGLSLDRIFREADSINEEDKKKLKEFVKNPKRFLVLQGPSGLGKTSIAYALCRELIDSTAAYSAKVIDFPALMHEFSFGRDSDKNPMKEFSKPGILAIDDIGAGGILNLSQARSEGFWGLINYRWEKAKPTILTTNLIAVREPGDDESTKTLQELATDSAWDRIADDGLIIQMKGTSIRGNRRKMLDNRNERKKRKKRESKILNLKEETEKEEKFIFSSIDDTPENRALIREMLDRGEKPGVDIFSGESEDAKEVFIYSNNDGGTPAESYVSDSDDASTRMTIDDFADKKRKRLTQDEMLDKYLRERVYGMPDEDVDIYPDKETDDEMSDDTSDIYLDEKTDTEMREVKRDDADSSYDYGNPLEDSGYSYMQEEI